MCGYYIKNVSACAALCVQPTVNVLQPQEGTVLLLLLLGVSIDMLFHLFHVPLHVGQLTVGTACIILYA